MKTFNLIAGLLKLVIINIIFSRILFLPNKEGFLKTIELQTFQTYLTINTKLLKHLSKKKILLPILEIPVR